MHHKAAGKLRIISGKWRSRRFSVPPISEVRPTSDKLRGILFNWLQVYIEGSTCLDCFSGSGAIGFEAASRGAKHVSLVEQNRTAYQSLITIQKTLQCEHQVSINCADIMQVLKQSTQKYDFIFIDPPFASQLYESVLSIILERDLLADKGMIYVEADLQSIPTLSTHWCIQKEKKVGQVWAALISVCPSPPKPTIIR